MLLALRLVRLMLPLVIIAITLFFGESAIAAEKVIIKYKIFQAPISVAELTTFAETGEASSGLKFYLKATRQNPDDVQKVLMREADVNVVTLEQALNNPVGGLLLDQINFVVHPRAKVVNRQAIRSALVLSASEDNKISLIEVIQNYPTSEVEVEGERIVQAYRKISALSGRVQNITDDLTQIFMISANAG